MDDPQAAPVVEAPVTPAPTSNDPFVLDEARVATLSPEQRAALEPIVEEWRIRARGEIEKTSRTWEEKYKPVHEKAEALDQLVKDQRFVQWWQGLQKASQQQGFNQQQVQDFATPEEYQQAIADAYSGNGAKLREIQTRMISAIASPVVNELRKSQQELRNSQEEFRTTQELKDLFERHPEAKMLDSLGRNPKDPTDTSLSHLEIWLNWASENNKPMEEGYARAKMMWDASQNNANKQALGLVQGKKDSTSGPSTNKSSGTPVVEVADADELMQKNMEAALSGGTPPRFVIRPSAQKERWAQRT